MANLEDIHCRRIPDGIQAAFLSALANLGSLILPSRALFSSSFSPVKSAALSCSPALSERTMSHWASFLNEHHFFPVH